jgi:hypothetical protein
MRYVPGSVKKSAAGEFFLARYKECETIGEPPVDSTGVSTVIADAMQTIRKISHIDATSYFSEANKRRRLNGGLDPVDLGHSSVGKPVRLDEDEQNQAREQPHVQITDGRTFSDVLFELRDLICDSLDRRGGGRYILCFDNTEHVPLTKGVTQRKRVKVSASEGRGRYEQVSKANKFVLQTVTLRGLHPDLPTEIVIPASELRIKQRADARDAFHTVLETLDEKEQVSARFDLLLDQRLFEQLADKQQHVLLDYSDRPNWEAEQEMVGVPPMVRLESRDLEPVEQFCHLDRPLPANWPRYLHSSRHRNRLIEFISFHLLDRKTGRHFPNLSVDSEFIIEGHCLSPKSAVQLLSEKPSWLDGESADCARRLRDTPIRVRYDSLANRVTTLLCDDEDAPATTTGRLNLTNQCGETDMSAFWFIKKLAPPVVEIHSTDTDYIFWGLMYLFIERTVVQERSKDVFEKRNGRKPTRQDMNEVEAIARVLQPTRNTKILIYRRKQMATAAAAASETDSSTAKGKKRTKQPLLPPAPVDDEGFAIPQKPKPATAEPQSNLITSRELHTARQATSDKTEQHQWIDINTLYDCMSRDPKLLHANEQQNHFLVAEFVAAALAAGSDYTDCFYYVPHQHFLGSYAALKEALVLMDNNERDRRVAHVRYGPDASRNFILRMISRRPVIDKHFYSLLVKMAYYSAFKRTHFKNVAFDVVVAMKMPDFTNFFNQKEKDPKKHFPTQADLEDSWWQLCYILETVCFQIGTNTNANLAICPARYRYSIARNRQEEAAEFDHFLSDTAPKDKRALVENRCSKTVLGSEPDFGKCVDEIAEQRAYSGLSEKSIEIVRHALMTRSNVERFVQTFSISK